MADWALVDGEAVASGLDLCEMPAERVMNYLLWRFVRDSSTRTEEEMKARSSAIGQISKLAREEARPAEAGNPFGLRESPLGVIGG